MAGLSPQEHDTLICLVHQAIMASDLRTLNEDGQLEFFRIALERDEFPNVVKIVKSELHADLFSSLKEIEDMEEEYKDMDATKITVQCCLILEFISTSTYDYLAQGYGERWLFGDIITLEGISYRRHLLGFIRQRSLFRSYVNSSMARAARDYSLSHTPTWQMLLPLLRSAGANCGPDLLQWFCFTLEEIDTDIPEPAAGLMLSYLSEAIYFSSKILGEERCVVGGATVVRLLNCGASLDITRESHRTLATRLRELYPDLQHHWWIKSELSEPKPSKPLPTTFYKLMAHRWEPEIMEKLYEKTCCDLDTDGSFERSVPRSKLVSLQCLALRASRGVDFSMLPITSEYPAHRPLQPEDVIIH